MYGQLLLGLVFVYFVFDYVGGVYVGYQLFVLVDVVVDYVVGDGEFVVWLLVMVDVQYVGVVIEEWLFYVCG